MTDPAADLLAEALAYHDHDDPGILKRRRDHLTDWLFDDCATGMLAHPRLRAALERGLALLGAEEAGAPGLLSLIHYEDYTGKRSWIAEVYPEEGARPTREWADTPTEALRALAAKLRGRVR